MREKRKERNYLPLQEIPKSVESNLTFSKCSLKYSTNKLRKAQNEHLIIICQNLIGPVFMNLNPISYFLSVYTT